MQFILIAKMFLNVFKYNFFSSYILQEIFGNFIRTENHLKNAWIVLNAVYFNHKNVVKFSWIYEDGKPDYKNENIGRKTLNNMLTLFNDEK